MTNSRAPALAATLLLCLGGSASAGEYSLPITADNSIVDYNGERDVNMGAASSLRLKVHQHHLVVKVDTSAVGDEQVVAATLRYRPNSETLGHVTISTVQGDWVEGTSGGFNVEEGSSCFLGAGYSSDAASMVPWSFPGSRFPDVVYGNGQSLLGQSESPVSDGYYQWTVPPDLVNAVAVGASYGLAVFDGSGIVSRNPTVYSREAGGGAPELFVTTAAGDPAPAAVTNLAAQGADDGEALLTWTVPAGTFAYDATIVGGAFGSATPLPRYLLPFAADGGTTQTLRILDILEPGVEYTVEVSAIARGGARSAPASIAVLAGQVEDYPGTDHEVAPPAGPATGISGGGLSLWAVPVTHKITPSGALLEAVAADYPDNNPVFDGERVTLRGLRNDMLSFLLVLQDDGTAIDGLSVTVSTPGLPTTLERVGFINTGDGPLAELLRGDPGSWGTAMDENAGDTQHAQAVLVDIEVPDSFEPGDVEGTVTVAGAGIDVVLPLAIEVGSQVLPDEPSFKNEMNDYGLPGYAATYEALQQAARRYRTHVNLVTYSHQRRTRMDMVLANGAYMNEAAYNDFSAGDTEGNWDEYAQLFGPMLDGSFFAGGPWATAALPGFYLSFHESWPLPSIDHYTPGSKDAFEAFPPAYEQTFEGVVADFVELATANGWTDAGFHIYLNNKPWPSDPPYTIVDGSTPWTLDEPVSYWDFRALGYFGQMVAAGAAAAGDVDIQYRIDVSRYPYHRGQLDGLVDLAVVNRDIFIFRRLVFDIARRDGTEIWNYGTANRVTSGNISAAGWVLSCYAVGCRGIVPWSTVQYGADYLTGTAAGQQQLALFVVASDSQTPEVVPSLRLAAFRRAALDVEYLELLRQGGDYTEGQIERLIRHYLDLDTAFSVSTDYAEDAGTISFSDLTSVQLWQLRSHVLDLLLLQDDPIGDDDDATGDDDDDSSGDDDHDDDDAVDDDDSAGDDDDGSCACSGAGGSGAAVAWLVLGCVLGVRRRSL